MTKQLSVIITRFPYESVLSGEEWHTITLAEKLRERGHHVAFYGSCPVLLAELGKRDFPVHKAVSGPVPVRARSLLGFLFASPYLKITWGLGLWRLKRRYRLSTVYMHSLSEKLLLTAWARMFGLRVVWVEHQRWGKWMFGNPLRFLYRILANYVEIIGVSPQYKEAFAKLGVPEKRTHLITNGIDLSVFHPDVTPLPLGNNAYHLGCIARLSVDKGVDVLLQAFSALDTTVLDKPVHLHLIGEGPLRATLEAQIRDFQLEGRVHLYVPYGTIPRSDTPRFMKALDVFLLPSALPDPFGLVAAESMAVGTATIVTNACGIRSLLSKDRDSIIVPAGNSQELTRAITKLLTNTKEREALALAGAKTAKEHFSLDTMVDLYLQVFTAQ